MERILKGYRGIDLIAACYKTNSIKSSEQFLRGQSRKIHIVPTVSKVPSYFDNRILRNSGNTKRVIEFIFKYIESAAKYCLKLLGSFEIILSSENKCLLMTETERHEHSHLSSSQTDTKLILHAHEILGSSKVAIHSPPGDYFLL